MADTKKLLDLQGLALYDSKLKAGIAEEYAKKADIKDPDLTHLATKEEVDQKLANVTAKEEIVEALKNYPTKQELTTELEKYPTKEEVTEQIDTTNQNVDNLFEFSATKEELKKAVAPLATKEELTTATTGLATKDEVTSGNSMLNNSITEVKGNVDTLGGRVEAIEQAEYVDQDNLRKIIAEANHLKKEIVDSLPDASEGVENVIYLVAKEGADDNIYDEYLLLGGKWEKIGDTQTKVDLSDYPTKDEMNTAIGQATGSIVIETISIEEINSLFASN